MDSQMEDSGTSSMDSKVNDGSNRSEMTEPFLIGVGGGTASGKSSVCRKIMEKLGQHLVDNNKRRVVCISQESFYKTLTEQQRAAAFKGQHDFDHPDAIDNELMLDCLKKILANQIVKLPYYDFKTHSCKPDEYITVYPADVVLFEGILAFYFPEIRNLFDMKLFVDTDPDTRLSRRVIRDVQERGRELDSVINQYIRFVKPAFEEFCQPTKKYADVIIPRGADNEVAINLIMKHIERYLDYCLLKRHSDLGDSGATDSMHASAFAELSLKHHFNQLSFMHNEIRRSSSQESDCLILSR